MNNKFNNQVKDAFDQVEDEFNPDLIWEGINAKMKPVKKKKRFLLWWIYGFGISVFVLSVFIYFIDSNVKINEKTVVEDKQKTSSSIASSIEEVGETDNKVLDNNSKTVDESNESLTKSNLKVDKNSNPSSNPHKNKVASYTTTENQNSFDNNDNIESSHLVNIEASKKSNYATISKLLISAENQKFKIDSPSEVEIVLPLELKNSLSLKSITAENFLLIELIPEIDTQDRPKNSQFFKSIELYKGVSIGCKSIVSSYFEYEYSRNKFEDLLEEIHVGVRFQAIQFLGLKVLAGMKYSRINDSWKMSLEYEEDRPHTYIDYITELPDGFLEDHYTNETLTHNIKRYIEQYNTEQIISFPIEFRYGKQLNNWTFSAGLGLEFGYLFAAEHKIPGLDGLPVVASRDGQWMSPSVTFGLFTEYNLSPNWSLTGNINYRQLSINDAMIVSDLRSRYTLYGAEVGVVRVLK